MICRGPLGQIEDSFAAGIGCLGVDWIDIDWKQTLRRALRLTSRAGRKIDVLLPPGARLAHGDILIADEPRVAIWVIEIDLLRICAIDPIVRAKIAFDLGNQHLPAQMTPQSILTLDDGPARAIAAARHADIEVVHQRFYPEPVTIDSTFS